MYMIRDFARLFHPFHPHRRAGADDRPRPADLAPEFGGRIAKALIASLHRERAEGRLRCIRQRDTGEWFIWLSDSVLPGGALLGLQEWAVSYLAIQWLALH